MARRLETLFERFRSRGDVGALGEVFDRTAAELFKLGIRLARDPGVAEELLQQTFLEAIERRERYDATRPLVPWLAGILSNLARRAWRDSARRPDAERLDRREAVRDPSPHGQVAGEVLRAMERLKAPYREVVVLHLRFGLAPAEIALVTDRDPGTVRSQLHRGLAKLRERLPKTLHAGVLAGHGLSGLPAIRSAVLEHAQVAAPAALATTIPTLVLGGIAVTKTQAAAAALLLVALLGGGMLVASPPDAVRVSDPEAEVGAALEADTDDDGPVALDGRGTPEAGETADGGAASTMAPTALDELAGWWLRGVVTTPGVTPAGRPSITPTGRPIAGARVEAFLERAGERELIGTAAADAAGRYRIPLDGLLDRDPLALRMSKLVATARAPGYVGGEPSLQYVARQGTDDLTLDVRMYPGVRVSGRVLDARGGAVRGALVRFRTEPPGARNPETHTDADGRYVAGLNVVTSAAVVEVEGATGTARSERFAVAYPQPVVVPDLVLRAAAFVEGRVVRPDGSPVEGIRVYGRQEPSPEAVRALPHGVELHTTEATTGDDGRFRLPLAAEGRGRILLERFGGGGVERVVAAGAQDVTLVADAVPLRVRAVDASGAPLPGAEIRVSVVAPDQREVFEALSEEALLLADTDPLFALERRGTTTGSDAAWSTWLPRGSVAVVRVYAGDAIPGEALARVEPGRAEAAVVVRVRRRGAGRGALRATLRVDGRPVRHVDAFLRTLGGSRVGIYWPDEEGRVVDLPLGRFRLRLQPGIGAGVLFDSTAPAETVVEITPGAVPEVALHAERLGHVTLTLTSDGSTAGRPPAPVQVALRPAGQPDAPWRPIRTLVLRDDRVGRPDPDAPTRRVVRLGEGVPVGRYQLRAMEDGFAPVELDVEVEPGRLTQVDAVLRRP